MVDLCVAAHDVLFNDNVHKPHNTHTCTRKIHTNNSSEDIPFFCSFFKKWILFLFISYIHEYPQNKLDMSRSVQIYSIRDPDPLSTSSCWSVIVSTVSQWPANSSGTKNWQRATWNWTALLPHGDTSTFSMHLCKSWTELSGRRKFIF